VYSPGVTQPTREDKVAPHRGRQGNGAAESERAQAQEVHRQLPDGHGAWVLTCLRWANRPAITCSPDSRWDLQCQSMDRLYH
jgi:hypothetical protein